MDVLTEHEIEGILQRLEALVTELEHDLSARTFYTFVLIAEAFARTKHALSSLAHLRRCLALAHRMRAVRDALLDSSSSWHPLTTVLEVIHSDATRLSTLYGVARPACRTVRREQQQAFRTAFAQATGKTYHPYGHTKTAKERTAITAFWDEALRTALARFQTGGEVDALDAVMSCLPAWADRRHERWTTQGWHEPSVKEVMQLVTDYLMICETCLGTVAQVAAAAVAQAPVVERAHVAPDIEQRYAAQVHALRDQIGAFAIPTDASRAQKAQLRREKTQLQQDLQALLSAQEAEITRHVKRDATARHKLAMLVKTTSGYLDTLRRTVGKASVDVLPRMIWIYDFARQGDDAWRAAKRDAQRFVREVRQAGAKPVAVEARKLLASAVLRLDGLTFDATARLAPSGDMPTPAGAERLVRMNAAELRKLGQRLRARRAAAGRD